MHYLAPPRIGFIGASAVANPSTANNNDVELVVDHGRVALTPPPELEPADADALRRWFMSLVTVQLPPEQDGDAPQSTTDLRAHWNYYGDHALGFGNAAVNSLWLPDAPPVTEGSDRLLGARVAINARLVDLDPSDTFSTQIISSMLKVMAVDPAGKTLELISGREPSIAYSRWLNFYRPLGAAVFQCVIATEHLAFAGPGYSAALDALCEAVQRGAGLCLRFCLYAMAGPASGAEALHERFQQGQYVMNPKTGRVLGSLSAWNGEDMRSAPSGRLLHVPASPYCRAKLAGILDAPTKHHVKGHSDLERLWEGSEKQVGPRAASAAGTTSTLPYVPGPAVAMVDHERRIVTLDLLSTFLETGKRDPASGSVDLSKIDIGPVRLALSYADAHGQTQYVDIGEVPYDRKTYEDRAGVVEVSFAGQAEVIAHIEQGTLLLCHDPDPHLPDRIVLQEVDVPVVETDDRCVYVNQDGQASITVRVSQKGLPITEPLTVELEQWHDLRSVTDAPTDESKLPVVVRPRITWTKVEPDDPACAIPATITVPAGGEGQIALAPRGTASPGCYKVRFIPPGLGDGPERGKFDPTIEFFANIRVLPADDYSDVPDEKICWDYVYKEVFSYYAVLYPIMSTIMPWGPGDAPYNRHKVREFASLIRRFVDRSNLASTMYMPITRELSDGKRALVQRWCDLQMRPEREP
ncbi:MAG TPA: hypothetical protein VFE42_28230 [Chloroflexota bacterium]|nr:hypothetical protein [Chloroflexota bacterium]